MEIANEYWINDAGIKESAYVAPEDMYTYDDMYPMEQGLCPCGCGLEHHGIFLHDYDCFHKGQNCIEIRHTLDLCGNEEQIVPMVSEECIVTPETSMENGDIYDQMVLPPVHEVPREMIIIDDIRENYKMLKRAECGSHPRAFMDSQPQVTPDMRVVLVDWLSKVNELFEYSQETFFITVQILDRFLASQLISTECFQLIGVTAFLLAGKLNEVLQPSLRQLEEMCAGLYTCRQVTCCELLVLENLKFRLLVPTAQDFLSTYLHYWRTLAVAAHSTDIQIRQCENVSGYILQECTKDYMLIQYPPSSLALAVLVLTFHHICEACKLNDQMYSDCGQYTPVTEYILEAQSSLLLQFVADLRRYVPDEANSTFQSCIEEVKTRLADILQKCPEDKISDLFRVDSSEDLRQRFYLTPK